MLDILVIVCDLLSQSEAEIYIFYCNKGYVN